MVPFQTMLALLALLIAMTGCSQKVPPGSLQPAPRKVNGNNQNTSTAQTTPSSTNSGNTGNTDAKNTISVVQDGAYWVAIYGGEDAEILYKALRIKSEPGVIEKVIDKDKKTTVDAQIKKGVQYSCALAESKYSCTFKIKIQGGLAEKNENTVTGEGVSPTADHPSAYIAIDKNNVARAMIAAPASKMIWEGLQNQFPPKDVLKDGVKAGAEVRANNILCSVTETNKDAPLCTLFLNYEKGEVQLTRSETTSSTSQTTQPTQSTANPAPPAQVPQPQTPQPQAPVTNPPSSVANPPSES